MVLVALPDRTPAQALTEPRAVALVALAIGSVQFGAALAVTVFDEATASGMTLVRLALAALVLLVVVRPAVRGRPLGLIVGFGLVLGAMNLCFYLAMDRIPIGAAVTIEFLGPLGVAAAHSRRPRDLGWVGLAAVGVVLLTQPFGDPLDGLGVLFAALAGVAWAAYILLSQRVGRAWPGTEGLAVAMAIAVLVPLGPGLASGGDLLDGRVLLVGLGVAVLSSVLPYALELEALRTMPARVFGVLMSVEPGVAALAGVVVLGQALDGIQWVAIGLVVLASLGATRAPVTV